MTDKTKTRAQSQNTPQVESPTLEQLASGNIIHNNKRYFVINQIPLDYYKNMKPGGINLTQFEAGNLLYQIFSKTGIDIPIVAVMGTTSLRAQGDSVTEKQVVARQQYRAAIKAVKGDIGQSMVENVCCYGFMLKDIPVPGYSRPAERMRRFQEALNDLVKHFHIPINARDRRYFYKELGWK